MYNNNSFSFKRLNDLFVRGMKKYALHFEDIIVEACRRKPVIRFDHGNPLKQLLQLCQAVCVPAPLFVQIILVSGYRTNTLIEVLWGNTVCRVHGDCSHQTSPNPLQKLMTLATSVDTRVQGHVGLLKHLGFNTGEMSCEVNIYRGLHHTHFTWRG